MELESIFTRFTENAEVFRHLASSITPEQARWKPAADRWSLLEVVHHLYDEEREDFRVRLDIVLNRPDTPFPPIDPEGWVTQRAYREKDLRHTLHAFLQERRSSVAWLRGLSRPDWNAAVEHAVLGRITAGDLLASWLAHDFLHMRQMARLHLEIASRSTQPYSTDYAGRW